ncbi:MAG: hypothetical protein U5K74_02920 [Gemmatimonadaceae bacterium]|nr:hypothetical protein [Gemmatimonadaceae bacterium]
MCGSPIAAWRPLEGVLCRSHHCAARHSALPSVAKCQECTRPLTLAQRAAGFCGSAACREEVYRTRESAAVARKAALLAELQRRRRRSAAQRGIPLVEDDTYRVALLPYNTDRVSRLPARRRMRHEAHLRACLAEARQTLAGSPPDARLEPAALEPVSPPVPHTPRQRAESQLLLAGCAACRGACCREAGDHAFISAGMMVGYLQRHPTADDDAVVAQYLSHIGDMTMTHGCVYQSNRGCTLAPALRADICHRFHCTGLMMLKGQFAEHEPVRAYMVHRRGQAVSGDRFVEIAVEGTSGVS